MAHQNKKPKKSTLVGAGPPMDARWLAIFMICCTQVGSAYELAPNDGPPPSDYSKTFATKMGLAQEFQMQFTKIFGKSFNAQLKAFNKLQPEHNRLILPVHPVSGETYTPADILETAAAILKWGVGNYKPPACPNDLTVQSAVGVLNIATLVNNGLPNS